MDANFAGPAHSQRFDGLICLTAAAAAAATTDLDADASSHRDQRLQREGTITFNLVCQASGREDDGLRECMSVMRRAGVMKNRDIDST